MHSEPMRHRRGLQVAGDLVTYSDLVLEGRVDGDCVCRRLTVKVGGMEVTRTVAVATMAGTAGN